MTNDIDAEGAGHGSGEFMNLQLSVLGHPVAPLTMPVEEGVYGTKDKALLDAQVSGCSVSHDSVNEGDGREGFAQTHAVRQDGPAQPTSMRVVLLHRLNYIVVEETNGFCV